MSPKSDLLYLDDIKKCIFKVEEFTAGTSRDEFEQNYVLQEAVIRQIEVIGEIAGRLSSDFHRMYPEFPANEMKAMRNIIAHQYDEVDLDLIWNAVKKDVPELKRILGIK